MISKYIFCLPGNNGKIVYTITAGDDKGDFKILPTGEIIVNKNLDREEQALYNLVVTATDQASDPEERLSSTVQVSFISYIMICFEFDGFFVSFLHCLHF